MKIEIEKTKDGMWTVSCGDKFTDELDFGEMLTILVQLTTSEERNQLKYWMLTKEQHAIKMQYSVESQIDIDDE